MSNGCNLWDVWGGRVKSVMPFRFAKSKARIDKWLSWLSKTSNFGLVSDEFEYFMKCSNVFSNSSAFIHPVLFARPSVFGIPFLCILGTNFTRGKTIAGGKKPPAALMIQNVVTSTPFSPLVACETCFVFLAAMTVGVFVGTVVVAVSSRLKTLEGSENLGSRS